MKPNATTTTTARKRKPLATPAPVATATNPAEIITAETVQTMGERIAVRALKTCYQKSGMPFIYSLYCGLIGDITERKRTGQPFSDGYDIAQTACAFLCDYIGKTLADATTDGQTDKDGNPATILRACFRAVNRYIMGERQREYKRAYIDEIDENGNALYYEIPDGWDIPTATDFHTVNEIITALKLSQNEKRFLSYRMRGISLDAIAQKMGIKRDTLNTYRKRIKDKARNVPALAPYCNA